nr:MAG TPA: hypothetical protein [Caudoviricetes sp.]
MVSNSKYISRYLLYVGGGSKVLLSLSTFHIVIDIQRKVLLKF